MLMSCSYTNPWLYNGKVFDTNDIQDYFGFVYHIRNNINGREYIGRKYLWSYRTPKGKKRKVKSFIISKVDSHILKSHLLFDL